MKSKWDFYTTKEIKPSGWLRKQLEIQAKGLSGNLDKMWRDIRDSKWIGGPADGWERVPYWLDGFIPLAYLLEDEDMIRRGKNYVDAILHQQKPDGWICPCSEEERATYDTWAVLLISKVLKVYYDCSGDERIPEALYRTMKNFYELLEKGTIKLFDWGKHRWYEAFPAINFLYDMYKEEWIKKLALILYEQGQDYGELTEHWKRPLNRWTQGTHIVNLGMMLKAEAVSCDILGQKYRNLAEKYYKILYKYNGTPVELFTGDECLSGLSPIQGTELCAVVEQMYSYELLYAYTGDSKWAERLEVIAFNALPATFSDDMWAHQYVQMSNQINCRRFPGRSLFRTNGPDAHLFGLEPNYGCCTANLNQGWPKLALSTFMHKGDTIINVLPIPSALTTKINGTAVHITLETNYPFGNTFTYKITAGEEVSFNFKIRIPSFAENVKLNNLPVEHSGELTVQVADRREMQIRVSYDTTAKLVDRPHSLKTVKCGSLVFSLPISYEKKMYEYVAGGVERKFPYCDYEYVGTSEWQYGFADDVFEKVEAKEEDDYVFSSEKPQVLLKANMQRINWGLEDGFEDVCAKKPHSYKGIGEKKEVLLYPYGCAKLRMTEMPLVQSK